MDSAADRCFPPLRTKPGSTAVAASGTQVSPSGPGYPLFTIHYSLFTDFLVDHRGRPDGNITRLESIGEQRALAVDTDRGRCGRSALLGEHVQ